MHEFDDPSWIAHDTLPCIRWDRTWVTLVCGWLVGAAMFWVPISLICFVVAHVCAPAWTLEHRPHIAIAAAVCAAAASAFVWYLIVRDSVSIESGVER